MPVSDSELHQLQRQFARDIRTGGNECYSEEPAMQIYRELFFNNVCGFLDGGFPVCRSIVGEERWRSMCRDFFRDHECETPYFLKISEEFLAWLAQHPAQYSDLPYLAELAHYEWLELAVDVMETTEEDPPYDQDADLMSTVPVFPQAVAAAAYAYPVHLACKENRELAEELTGMILFRDSKDKVRFVHCNPFTLRLFECLRTTDYSGEDGIRAVLEESAVAISPAALKGGTAILNSWREQGLILGGRISL